MILEALEREGVEYIFGYPGGANLPIYQHLPEHPRLKHILVRHEQGAAHMADGYARACGKPGVVFATSGPGALNLVTGHLDEVGNALSTAGITGVYYLLFAVIGQGLNNGLQALIARRAGEGRVEEIGSMKLSA